MTEDLLAQRPYVFAECVNPINTTRDACTALAQQATAGSFKVELTVQTRWNTNTGQHHTPWTIPTCPTDPAEHRRPNHKPGDRDHTVVDTAGKSVEDTIAELGEALSIDT